MGSGKSTLGKELAQQLRRSFIETDDWIERSEEKKISEIFSEKGETHFREKESLFLHQLQLVDECIIATGGGMPCYKNNMELMNQLGMTIWLDVEENMLVERLKKEKNVRPLLANVENVEQKIHELLKMRSPSYSKAKHIIKNPTANNLLELIASG